MYGDGSLNNECFQHSLDRFCLVVWLAVTWDLGRNGAIYRRRQGLGEGRGEGVGQRDGGQEDDWGREMCGWRAREG